MKKTNKEENEKEEKVVPDYIGHRGRLKKRFLTDCGKSMPDYELLELLLAYAIPRQDTKPLAKKLLKIFPNYASVIAADVEDLIKVKGIGESVAVLLKLVHATVNKINWENLENKDTAILKSKDKIVEYCRSCIGRESKENLLVLFLNTKGVLITKEILNVGTIDAVMICPRTIIEKCLNNKAKSVILCHNHPSGDCTPSRSDLDMTWRVKNVLESMDMELDDHIIISSREYYSMREHVPFMRKDNLIFR